MEIEIIDDIERSLSLEVKKKTLGEIETNALQIHKNIKAVLTSYKEKEYDSSMIAEAKKDRALLNKAEKAIKSDMKNIKEEFIAPLKQLEGIIANISEDIAKTSATIDIFVKSCETKEKEAKKEDILKYYNSKIGDNKVLTFDDVFKEQWLNKTYSEKNILDEIDMAIANSNQELEVISQSEDKEELLEIYLLKKNYIASVQELKVRKERKEKAKEVIVPKEVIPIEPGQRIVHTIKKEEDTFTMMFTITGTKERLLNINKYLKELGVLFTVVNPNK